MDLPIGYRFLPTEQELVIHYLQNKALGRRLPAEPIVDINASTFYSEPPMDFVVFGYGEEQQFFFIHGDDLEKVVKKKVGNGVGYWMATGEDRVRDEDGSLLAFKISWRYFSGPGKRTAWRMEVFRLHRDIYDRFHEFPTEEGECVAARILRGPNKFFLSVIDPSAFIRMPLIKH